MAFRGRHSQFNAAKISSARTAEIGWHRRYCGETFEDQEEALAKFVVEDGVDDDGRQAFCGGVVKDCRESAFEEYAKRQSISNLLSGIDDPGDPMHKPKPEMRKKKRKRKKKAAADEL